MIYCGGVNDTRVIIMPFVLWVLLFLLPGVAFLRTRG